MKKILTISFILFYFINNLFSQEVIIGENDYEEADLPFTRDRYSYSQSIYKQQWIHSSGSINKLAYYFVGNSTEVFDIDIYMVLTHLLQRAGRDIMKNLKE